MSCGNLTLSLVGGYEWSYATAFTVELSGFKNRPYAGASGLFAFATYSSGDEAIEEAAAGSFSLIPNNLSFADVTPDSFIADTTESLTLNITSRNVVPPDCIFLVTLPDAYTFTNGSVAVSSSTIDGTLTLSTINRDVLVSRSTRDPVEATETSGVVRITRTGGTLLSEGASMLIVFGDILKKESSGSTGTFDVAMQTIDKLLMDTTFFVEGHYFVYPPPEISDISPYNSPKMGGVSITIYGANYGPIQDNPSITNEPAEREIVVGDTSCTTTVWTADTAMVTLHPPPSTLNPHTLNPQPSTLNPQPSTTLYTQPSTLSPQPSTLNPQPSTLKPNP